ncbi:MAG: hypothetical protein H0U95_10190 [Bacteroidetes bacterium]|nr:hypothetical protein [Bacteroidota bacterium]
MRLLLFLALLINLFLLNSCKKYVPADAAFFIKPDPVSVAITSSLQGSTSSKITDLWLYVNGKFQGAYPTGNLLPIISKGERVKISILAGIKKNGISDTRTSWIFYDYLTIDTTVESGKTFTRPITFRYNPNTTFAWMENFDGQGFTLVKSIGDVNGNGNSDATWTLCPTSEAFEGNSAMMDMTGMQNGATGQVESAISYTLPLASANVFLEVNFKGNQGFEVGVISGTTTKSTLFVNPSPNWNKIYISLADVINKTPNSTAQKIYFKMVKTAENPNPVMYLDNIKVIYL